MCCFLDWYFAQYRILECVRRGVLFTDIMNVNILRHMKNKFEIQTPRPGRYNYVFG